MRIVPALLIPFLVACGVTTEPLRYGKDACHFCKMILMDKKFGAEVVTKKGKVYKFDDTNCMLNFMNDNPSEVEESAIRLIVDYTQPEKLIPVEQAFFLHSDSIRSPMNSTIAAFETEKAMWGYKEKWKAANLGWGEVQTRYK
jgi:copper chaperone NosL